MMTKGEKLVWAAAFVDYLRTHERQYPLSSTEDMSLCAVNAIEIAGDVVEYLHAADKAVQKGYGINSITYKMYKQMISNKNKQHKIKK